MFERGREGGREMRREEKKKTSVEWPTMRMGKDNKNNENNSFPEERERVRERVCVSEREM